MGATGSSSKAVIAVQVDNQGPVYGGGQLTGKVYLSIPKDGFSADTLNLKFYGQEATCVHYTETEDYTDSEGKSQSRSVNRTAYDSSPIIVIDLPLTRFTGGKVEKGSYEFPFVFMLPYGLPGKQGEKSNASYYVIEYLLEARLHRPGWMKWDVVNHQEIFLMDPPQASVKTPSFNEPMTRPVYFMCCLNQGNMSLLTNVDDTHIGVGESLKIDYSVHNASSASVKALEISLTQSIRYSARGHTNLESRVLYKNRIDASALQGADRSPKNNARPNLLGAELFREMNSHLANVQLMIPACRSTVTGTLGSVRHTVLVRIITKMCVQNPQLEMALSIYQPSPLVFQGVAPAVGAAFARPNDWQAQAAPIVTLQQSLAVATAVAVPQPPIVNAVVVGMQYNPTASAPSTPTAPSAPSIGAPPDLSSVSSLVSMLQTQGNAFTEVSLLKEWLTYGEVSNLVSCPGSLASIFGAIRGEYALTAFPEEIAKALPGQLRTAHVAEAAGAVQNVASRAKICSAFAGFVTDKKNARSAFEVLKFPEHMMTLVLLQYGQ